MTSARYELMKKIHGEEKFFRIWNAKVLVVGAGGIGCEILKNLALLGFHHVELIDLDTIDVSNLNRQFLFRPQHVGQPKAVVAAEAARRFNADLCVTAHHANIKDAQFNTAYFAQFDLVLNALDNVDARRHVNRLCLAANVPLFDSGTTGYLGQVVPVLRGYTACYECFPKPTQKVFPICTIRNTPDKPVHCIVWAKEALKLLFGRAEDSMLFENAEEDAAVDRSEYMHLVRIPEQAMANDTERGEEALLAHVRALLVALFRADIEKRIEMGVYKTAKTSPVPLSRESIDNALARARHAVADPLSAPSAHTQGAHWEQRVWSVEDCMVEFFLAFHQVLCGEREGEKALGSLVFDKDDEWGMKFVAAAANLRSAVFSIPLLSFHDAKGVAGNIIPAIATTNAIIAAAQCAEAVKFLTLFRKEEFFSEDLQVAASSVARAEKERDFSSSVPSSSSSANKEQLRTRLAKLFPSVYCLRFPTRKGQYLQPCSSDTPVAACYVCGKAQLTLQIDTQQCTLAELLSKVIKGRLGFNEPTIACGANLLYEEGEGCDEDFQENLPRVVSQCPGGGIVDGSMLNISDFTQDLEVNLLVKHIDNAALGKIESAATDLFILEGKDAFEQRQKEQAEAAKTEEGGASSEQVSTAAASDDDFEVVEEGVTVVDAPVSKKREVEEAEESEPAAKKQRN